MPDTMVERRSAAPLRAAACALLGSLSFALLLMALVLPAVAWAQVPRVGSAVVQAVQPKSSIMQGYYSSESYLLRRVQASPSPSACFGSDWACGRGNCFGCCPEECKSCNCKTCTNCQSPPQQADLSDPGRLAGLVIGCLMFGWLLFTYVFKKWCGLESQCLDLTTAWIFCSPLVLYFCLREVCTEGCREACDSFCCCSSACAKQIAPDEDGQDEKATRPTSEDGSAPATHTPPDEDGREEEKAARPTPENGSLQGEGKVRVCAS